MISYYQHPYLLASPFFYKKYIINQTEKVSKYDFDNLKNGFFLGCRPNCVHVIIDENHQEAILNNFTYFRNFSLYKNNPIKMAIKIIKEKYSNVKTIKLTDKTTINIGVNKYPLYIYMILYYGETYYMKYGFLPNNKADILELINSKIFEKTIKLENIIDFFEESNKDLIGLCEKIIRKNNKLKYFLEKIKIIKDENFFALLELLELLEYIYKKFFPGFNFFEETYYLNIS
jgi:hypothetical protein